VFDKGRGQTARNILIKDAVKYYDYNVSVMKKSIRIEYWWNDTDTS
jgi:hypothetical protein